MKLPWLLWVFCCAAFLTLESKMPFLTVDFDDSMQAATFANLSINSLEADWYSLFKNHYQACCAQRAEGMVLDAIPCIIHQIWLGSPLPAAFKAYQASWQQQHPDWHYLLWADAQVAQLSLINQDLFDAADNNGEKSDILRYELLYQFGGLYVDVDFECLKPFDELQKFDFYIGIQPFDTDHVQVGIGLIGAKKHHPLLAQMIALLRFTRDQQQIIKRTGPQAFTCLLSLTKHVTTRDLILPASYFYPRGYTQTKDEPAVWLKPESYAVHHWAGSWLKPEAWVAKK
jgi:mannosyltransferase OCH1-like enzyme